MYGYLMACMFTGPNSSGFFPISVSQLSTTLHMEFEGHFMGLTPQSCLCQTISDLVLYSCSKTSYIINKVWVLTRQKIFFEFLDGFLTTKPLCIKYTKLIDNVQFSWRRLLMTCLQGYYSLWFGR